MHQRINLLHQMEDQQQQPMVPTQAKIPEAKVRKKRKTIKSKRKVTTPSISETLSGEPTEQEPMQQEATEMETTVKDMSDLWVLAKHSQRTAPAKGYVKKPYQFWPGTVALWQIWWYQQRISWFLYLAKWQPEILLLTILLNSYSFLLILHIYTLFIHWIFTGDIYFGLFLSYIGGILQFYGR